MIEKTVDFNPEQVKTINIDSTISRIYWSQSCMLCENTREVPTGYDSYPWICDECKEAMSFLKDFLKHATVTEEMLNEMENPNENIYPL